MIPLTYTPEQLAKLFQYTEGNWRAQRPKLEKLGFPTKIPGTARYSKVAVDDWIKNPTGNPELTVVTASNETEPDKITAALEKEYAI